MQVSQKRADDETSYWNILELDSNRFATMMEMKLGRNTTIYPGDIVGPNAITEDDNVIYPNTVLHKNWRGKPGKYYYQGSPGRPIDIQHKD